MNKAIILLCFLLFVISCKKNVSIGGNQLNEKMAKFDSKLIDHFPHKNISNEYDEIVNENVRKNTIGILFYEYNVNSNYLDSLEIACKTKSIARYKNSDSCLLLINQFETAKTYSESEEVFIDFEKRKTEVNKDCYKNKLPIPKFLDYRFINNTSRTYLNDNFEFYILGANNKDFFKKFDLISNPQMPDNWSNGYSKGIAISKKDRCVIFWGVIW